MRIVGLPTDRLKMFYLIHVQKKLRGRFTTNIEIVYDDLLWIGVRDVHEINSNIL